jgi:uncharacterized protein YerC
MTTIYDILDKLDGKKEIALFLQDLCTPTELRFLSERWRIAQLLSEGKMTHHEMAKKNKYGVSTVTRVSGKLKENPDGGFNMAMRKLATKN